MFFFRFSNNYCIDYIVYVEIVYYNYYNYWQTYVDWWKFPESTEYWLTILFNAKYFVWLFWKNAAKAFSCSSESRVAPRNLRLWHLWGRFLYWISKSHLTIFDQRRNTLKRKSGFWSLFRLLARDQAAICNWHWKRL